MLRFINYKWQHRIVIGGFVLGGVVSGCGISLEKGKHVRQASAVVQINVPEQSHWINPLIYGEMLENCNDSIIYNGIVYGDGST